MHRSKTSSSPVSFVVAVAGCVLLLLSSTAATAEDWPAFRGPAGNGISTESSLPPRWDEATNVVWRKEIAGGGWSSPCLSAGKIYLTAAVPVDPAKEKESDLSLRAICLDAASGDLLWDEEIFLQSAADAPKIHGKNSHASPTPWVDGDRLFVHFGHMGTACLTKDGKTVWKTQELAYQPVHGNGCSPILVGDLLVFSCDGGKEPFVAALDANTGNLRWKFMRPGDPPPKTFAFCTPTAITVGGKTQIITPGAGSVSALNPADGTEIWRVKHEGYSVIPKPVFAHGLVFISTSYDAASILAIKPDGVGDVTETHVVWTAKRGAPHTPSLLVVGDELYAVADRGLLTCFDAKSGEQHYQERIGGNYSSSPVFGDGRIYIQSEEGNGITVKPGKEFVKLDDLGFKERTLSSYGVGGGAIFVRTEKALYRIEAGASN